MFTLDIGQLKSEIDCLEELARQLFLEAHSARSMMERIQWSGTLQGKYFNCLGYFFSLYCMWKIFIVCIFLILKIMHLINYFTFGIF